MEGYRDILVAIDCSPVDETLLDHVSALAAPLGARVHLLHVVHSHTLDQERTLREQAMQALERYRTTLTHDGLEVELHIRSGEPDREILKEIGEQRYDLLALAAHGHGMLERALFGSVSRRIRDKVSIPLLLVGAG
ncbi:MAG: universal stress protein [Chlorobiaceae bacterium]|nr:universal stress protein [Chlorobiaceae bacterium]